MDARALWSWVHTATQNARVDFSNVIVPEGTEEYTVQWLEKGETCSWEVTCLEDTDSILVQHAFLPARVAEEDVLKEQACEKEEVTVLLGEPQKGSWTASEPGALWLSLNNVTSWWSP